MPMFAGAPVPPLKTTLCAFPSVHVTVPPAAMSTLAGSKEFPGVVTVAFDANADVTLIVMKLDAVALPSVASAVMLAVPVETPVTSPVAAATAATPVAFELHVTVAPEMGFPFWFFGDAVSCSVAPVDTVVAGPDTTTDVNTSGACMVRTTLLVTLNAPDVATTVMVTLPAATPVTSPVVETVASAVLELDHANVAPMFPPNWSRALAVSCSVWPTVTDVVAELIETVVRTGFAAATVSERVAVSVRPEAVACALITTVPAASAVTSPVWLTDATVGALVSQLIVADSGFPAWSSALAEN